jgi:hypothetical protein
MCKMPTVLTYLPTVQFSCYQLFADNNYSGQLILWSMYLAGRIIVLLVNGASIY